MDPAAVWAHTAPAGESAPKIPWLGAAFGGDEKPSEDDLKRRDDWRKIFMPYGTIVAGRVDDRAWLTAGCADYLPLLVDSDTVLMVPPGVEAPVRAGVFHQAPPPPPPAGDDDAETGAVAAEADDKDDTPPPGWIIAPPGYELRLRMSGLLWPEAAERIAHGAAVAREQVGAGQVILFGVNPLFRGSTAGTARLFMNAVVCGPGMGTQQPILP